MANYGGRNGLDLANSVKSPMFISNVGYYVSVGSVGDRAIASIRRWYILYIKIMLNYTISTVLYSA